MTTTIQRYEKNFKESLIFKKGNMFKIVENKKIIAVILKVEDSKKKETCFIISIFIEKEELMLLPIPTTLKGVTLPPIAPLNLSWLRESNIVPIEEEDYLFFIGKSDVYIGDLIDVLMGNGRYQLAKIYTEIEIKNLKGVTNELISKYVIPINNRSFSNILNLSNYFTIRKEGAFIGSILKEVNEDNITYYVSLKKRLFDKPTEKLLYFSNSKKSVESSEGLLLRYINTANSDEYLYALGKTIDGFKKYRKSLSLRFNEEITT